MKANDYRFLVAMTDIDVKLNTTTIIGKGIRLPVSPITVSANFENRIGTAVLSRDGDSIYANVKFSDKDYIIPVCYPTICVEGEVENGVMHSCLIQSVGLCLTANVDGRIGPISKNV